MPCHSAMMKNVLVVQPEEKVEKVLSALEKKKAEIAVIVDEDGILLGYFNMKVLLRNLLPVSLNVQSAGFAGGGNMIVGAAPGIAKRLRKVKPLEVLHVMDRNIVSVAPTTPTWEGVQMLVEHGGPIFVIEDDSEKKYVGVMNDASALAELERIQKEQEE